MRSLFIEEPGLFTTVQDAGRHGFRRFGLAASGAVDQEALRWANWLVGNPPGFAALEATWTGPEVALDHEGRLAVCGADMTPCLNGDPIENNRTVPYKRGDRLSFTSLKSGLRAVIAFSGGIDCPLVLGSRSTHVRAAIGGHQGRPLKAGDRLTLGPMGPMTDPRTVPEAMRKSIPDPAPLRIVAGPEAQRFTFDALRDFLTRPYRLTSQCDRMGCRLEGPPLENTGKADILSAGIPVGTVQVPGNDQPIITLADGQTTGGYARMATVISIDLPILAQLKPDDRVIFTEVRPREAERLFLGYRQSLEPFTR